MRHGPFLARLVFSNEKACRQRIGLSVGKPMEHLMRPIQIAFSDYDLGQGDGTRGLQTSDASTILQTSVWLSMASVHFLSTRSQTTNKKITKEIVTLFMEFCANNIIYKIWTIICAN